MFVFLEFGMCSLQPVCVLGTPLLIYFIFIMKLYTKVQKREVQKVHKCSKKTLARI